MKSTAKSSLQSGLRSLIAGTQKHLSNESLAFDNATYTAPSVIQKLKSLDDATSALDAARAKWQDAVKQQRAVKAEVAPVLKGYRTFLVARFGTAIETLADFGLTPPKARSPRKVKDMAVTVAKNLATRTARHTVGPKKKAAIKGTVDAAATAASPAPTPAPAPAPTKNA